MEPDARRDAELGTIVAQLREEISQLRREVSGLRCEVGYWKSRHADTLKADETRWLVFVEKECKNGHRWWLWVFAGEETVLYVLDPSRSHAVPEAHFPTAAEGVLMVDRSSAYKAIGQVKDGKLLLAFFGANPNRRANGKHRPPNAGK